MKRSTWKFLASYAANYFFWKGVLFLGAVKYGFELGLALAGAGGERRRKA